MKNREGVELVLSMPQAYPPTEIITGSSRVIWGFRQTDMLNPAAATVLNVGLSGATMPDIDRIVRAAAASPTLERVWIGLDFGAVALAESRFPAANLPTERTSPRLAAIRHGLLSPGALRATLEMVRHPQTCAEPPFDRFGFANPGTAPVHARSVAVLPGPAARSRLLGAWGRSPPNREALYAREMARFTRLLADLKHQDIAVILYVGPTHPAYDSLVAEAGLVDFRARWRTEIVRTAREQGAVLVPVDRPDFLDSLPELPANCEAAAADCAFYDATHFRPFVGAAIISEGHRLSELRPGSD
tara:strand:+ start:27436 stop:28341 length:906 start_codon:yes stop_codon:yes gene_type:complete